VHSRCDAGEDNDLFNHLLRGPAISKKQ
jgi:hypothetical protein